MSLKVLESDGSLSPAPRNLPNELFIEFERSDDSAIMAELQGAVVEEYVYSFKQGNSTVTGLSLPGVMAVAQRMGGITCGQPIWTITEDDITCDISATDHKVGLTVWGTATAPFEEYNKRDKFARAKALSKAQRNAIRKVIPETVATKMLQAFIAEKSGQRAPQPRQQPRQQLPAPAPRPAVEATVIDGNVVTDDGEIMELEDSQPSIELLLAELQRRLRGAHSVKDLRAVREWSDRVGLRAIDEAKAAFNERVEEVRAAGSRTASIEQPALVN